MGDDTSFSEGEILTGSLFNEPTRAISTNHCPFSSEE
jgi:hypothetical protein